MNEGLEGKSTQKAIDSAAIETRHHSINVTETRTLHVFNDPEAFFRFVD